MGNGNALGQVDIRSVPVYIYGLCDPLNGQVRYVGRSQNPKARIASHRAPSGADYVRRWFRSLERDGLKPVLTILHTVQPGQDADPWERQFIERFSARGCNLLNRRLPDPPRAPFSPIPRMSKGAVRRTDGQTMLQQIMTARDLKQTHVARMLGCPQGTVSRWLDPVNPSKPGAVSISLMERVLGIPRDAWIPAAVRAHLAELPQMATAAA